MAFPASEIDPLIRAKKFDDAAFKDIASVEKCDNCHAGLAVTFHEPSYGGDLTTCRLCHSAKSGGSPGTDDSGQVPPLGVVVVNELLANSQGSGPDWIELHNTTDQPITIAGWFLSDDANNLTKYEIAAGTKIAADGYIVFYENRHFANTADPGCHERFGLSANGETLYLHSGSAGVLTGYSQQEKFDASEAGVSLGRYQKSTGTYNFVAQSKATPGQENAAPQVGPIVIDEIMYHPDAPADAEYVELLNISDKPVTLYDAQEEAPWRFSNDTGIEFLFPVNPPLTLAAGEYLRERHPNILHDATLREHFARRAQHHAVGEGAANIDADSKPAHVRHYRIRQTRVSRSQQLANSPCISGGYGFT